VDKNSQIGYVPFVRREKNMKNTPLSSIKVSDRTFEKIQIAVKKSGMDRADVIRWAIRLGLDSLEKTGYDVEGAVSQFVDAQTVAPMITSLPNPKPVKNAKAK
jgi:hypothetical protein